MNKRLIVLVVAVLIVGAAVYGLTRNSKTNTSSYGSSSNTSQTSPANPTPSSTNSAGQETTNPSSSSTKSTKAVSINNFAFSPKDITVKRGAIVTWTNNDSVAHTVQETDGKTGPKSDDLAQGTAFSYTFTAAGTYAYHCSIHPDMTGTVTVTE